MSSKFLMGVTPVDNVLLGTLAVDGIVAGVESVWQAAVPPAAPTALAATAGDAQLSLAWTAPSDPGTSPITGYVVEYTPSGGSPQTASTGSTGTSYTLTGLTNGTAYSVRVAAVSDAGTGEYSAAASGVPAAPPVITITSHPENQTASDGAATFSVTATVTQSATLSYQWQKSDNSGATWANVAGATSGSLALSGLTNADDDGDQYRVVVSATGGASSVTSNSATLTVPAVVASCESSTGVCLSVTGGYSQGVLSINEAYSNKPVESSGNLGACDVSGVLAQLTVNTGATGAGDTSEVYFNIGAPVLGAGCSGDENSLAGTTVVRLNKNGAEVYTWTYLNGGGNGIGIQCKDGDVFTVEALVAGITIPSLSAYGQLMQGFWIGCPSFTVSGSAESVFNGEYRARGYVDWNGTWNILGQYSGSPDIVYLKINNDGSVDQATRIYYEYGPNQWVIMKDYWTTSYFSTANADEFNPDAAFAANVPTTNWYFQCPERPSCPSADITVTATAGPCSGYITA